MNLVKLNLGQIDEAGDIVGWPLKEYECQILQRVEEKDGTKKVTVLPKTIWVNDRQLEDGPGPNMKYRQTGNTRMTYAKPAWVPEYNENGTILLLDDYNRSNNSILQACMELILEQKYISWSLPKRTTVVLTNNPENGEYNVQSQDEAQVGRYVNWTTSFSIDPWMQWAEKAKIDGRCINFVASYYNELFNSDGQGNRICNPRSFVMFAKSIASIKDWDNSDSMNFISTISRGCFKDDGRFSKMFTSFIRNKMHLLIQPKDMLLGNWTEIKAKMEKTLYDSDGNFRPDIANLLERRFSNFVNAWLSSDDKTPVKKVQDRLNDFLDNDKKLFTKDQLYHMIKTITSENKKQTNALLYDMKIAKIIN